MRALPPVPCGPLRHADLPAGTELWRVHPRKHPGDAFCPLPADALFGGGRFDSTGSDAYPFLYAGLTAETALCETLLRDLKFRGTSRQVLRAQVRGRTLSSLTTTMPLTMLSLASAVDLASICQPDDWLLRANGHEYAQTRAWAHWLRAHASTVHGFIWQSRYNVPHAAIILFGDRCLGTGPVPVTVKHAISLDGADGADYLNSRLAQYHVSVAPPRPIAAIPDPQP